METPASIGVTGVGMVSSLGADAVTSCAAARAGLVRPAELTVLDFAGDGMWGNEPVVGYPVEQVTHGFVGMGRSVRLGDLALRDLVRQYPPLRGMTGETGTGLFVAVAEGVPEEDSAEGPPLPPLPTRSEQIRGLGVRLAGLLPWAVADADVRVYEQGRMGALHALRDGIEALRARRLKWCIVGGVGSCIDPPYLERAAVRGLLKTAANPAGFMPGEAAAFVLLERIEDVQRRGAAPDAVVGLPAFTAEPRPLHGDEPPRGKALAEAIRAVASTNPQAKPVGLVTSDLNGDPARAAEWGRALVHLGPEWSGLPLWIPALSFGEVGAASVFVALCMVVRGWVRGYAPAGDAVLMLSAERGERGAVRLTPSID